MAKAVAKQLLIAGLVLYLLLGIVRPAMRKLTQLPQPPALPGPGADGVYANGNGARLPGAQAYEQTLQNAKQIAKQDPKVVVNVVKEWVSSGE